MGKLQVSLWMSESWQVWCLRTESQFIPCLSLWSLFRFFQGSYQWRGSSLVISIYLAFSFGFFYNFPEQEIRRNGNAWAIIIGITQSQAPIDYLVQFFRAHLRASTRAYRESPWFIQMVASNLVFLLLIASMLSSWNWMPATSLSWYNRLQGISKAYSISVEGTSNHVSRLKIGVRYVMVVHHIRLFTHQSNWIAIG